MKLTSALYTILMMLAITMAIASCTTTQTATAPSAKVSKEAKLRWKEYKKQGFRPDPRYGTGPMQFQKIIDSDLALNDKEKLKYFIETQNGTGTKEQKSFTEARQNARRELAANLGSFYEELIEGGTYFNIYGEDLSDEIWESVSAFDEVFAAALSKNDLVSRFYRTQNNLIESAITIRIDMEEFDNQLRSMKKDELRDRIEEVRAKKDNLLKKN